MTNLRPTSEPRSDATREQSLSDSVLLLERFREGEDQAATELFERFAARLGLRFVDADSVRGDGGELKWLPTGGWRQEWTRGVPAAGFQKDGWKGVGWAPVSAGLAKRKFWVVEGVPEDRYYLYGKVELWIDTESWIGSFNRKFSWKGEVLNTYQVNGYLNHPAPLPDSEGGGYEWFWSSQHAWQCAEALKHNRATLAGLRADLVLPFDRRVRHNTDQLFDVSTLSRFGK